MSGVPRFGRVSMRVSLEAEAFDQFVGEVCLVRAPERGAGIGNGGIRLVALAEHGIGALSKVQDA